MTRGLNARRPTIGHLLAALVLGALATPSLAGTLVINANTSDPVPRAAWEAAVAAFQKEHRDVQVKFNIYDHESYKKSIRNWLTGGSPDVVFWFAGNRMREFVARGLLEDVSALFTPETSRDLQRSAIDLVTVGGRQYGVPYSYYQVGFYFRRDLLDKSGVQPPRDWEELLAACDKLKASGIDPFAVGSRDLWPTAAWFDYLNLRLNGHRFHMQLMAGRIAYTDERVRALFAKWQELLERGCFVKSHASMSWQESQALLYQGRAAMMLIGNYIVANFPADVKDRMEFAPFPTLRNDIGSFEDAPMNTIHLPARAANKEDARRFLAYVLRAEVQEALNRALLLIPVNRKAAIADDRFLEHGRELLDKADALAQFFDRDTSEDLATIAMKGFQEFMINPDRLERILDTIEQARKRIYKD